MTSGLIGWANRHQGKAATVAGAFQQAASIGGAALTIPFVIGALGDKQAGVWFSLQGVIAIFSLSDFGFSMAISRQVAYSFKSTGNLIHSNTDLFDIGSGWDAISTLYSASKAIFLRVMLAALAVFALAYVLIVPHTNLIQTRNYETMAAWHMLALVFAGVFLTRLSQSFLDGLGFMYVGRFISGFYQVLACLLCIATLRLHFGLTGLAAGLLVASVAQLIMMHIALARVAGGRLAPPSRPSSLLIRRLWRVSIPFGITNTGGYLVGAVQVPLLGALLGPGIVAPMYIALRISQALNSTILQVVVAQLPFFTQQCAQGRWLDAKRRMLETVVLGSIFQAAVAFCLFSASPTLVDWWVGPGHYIGGPVLLVFSINYAVTCLAGLPAQFVLASGRNPFALSTVLHGILTLAGMLFLCPRIGLLGAPLATLIAVLLTNFWLSPYEAWKTWRQLFKVQTASDS